MLGPLCKDPVEASEDLWPSLEAKLRPHYKLGEDESIPHGPATVLAAVVANEGRARSEERRVGKEC